MQFMYWVLLSLIQIYDYTWDSLNFFSSSPPLVFMSHMVSYIFDALYSDP